MSQRKKKTTTRKSSKKKTTAKKPAARKKALPVSPPESKEPQTILKQVVRLPEVFDGRTPGPDLLENLTFVDCVIMGPGVLALIDNVEMNGVTFEDPEVFFSLEVGRTYFGMIGCRNCSFYQCRFERIGIAAQPELIQQALRGCPARRGF